MKKCFKCNIEKPLSEFYKHKAMADGYLGKCKDCTKKDASNSYKILSQDKDYILAERKRNRERYHRLNYKDKHRGDIGAKKQIMERYKEKYPEKRKAHIVFWNALKNGIIKKEPCKKCGNTEVEAHHEDYSKPLDVIWLCIKHHNERHVKLREEIFNSANFKPVRY